MPDTTEIAIFFILFLIGIFGFICALLSLYIIYKKPILHNAFGYICAAHTLIEAGILFLFVFWSAPIILINPLWSQSIFGAIFGQTMNILYYSAFIFQLFKSANRLFATIFSIKYRIIFTVKNAKILIITILLLSLTLTSPYYIYECNLLFNTEAYLWQIRDSSCETLFTTIDLGTTSSCTTMAFVLDIITLCYLRFKLYKKSTPNLSRDIRFFAQTCITTLLYSQMFISFYILSRFASTLWTIFISTTMAWLLGHALNQVNFILFNLIFTADKKPKLISSLTVVTPTATIGATKFAVSSHI